MILDHNLDCLIKERSKEIKSNYYIGNDGFFYYMDALSGELLSFSSVYAMYNCYNLYSDLINYNEFRKYTNNKCNRAHKRQRCYVNLKKIIEVAKSINGTIVFGTLTYTNEFMLLKEETRIKQIQRFLKKHFCYVLKNKDFGSKTDREHIHYIAITKEPLINTFKKSKQGRLLYKLEEGSSIGFNVLEQIPYNIKNGKRLSNYLVKLNNHSNKNTVHKTRLSILKNDKLYNQYLSHV